MAKAKKKLKTSDINRNSSAQIYHTIQKIKEHERRYTVILVLFFLVLFLFVGYYSLSVSMKYFSNNNLVVADAYSNYYSASSVVTLTEKDIMSDSLGVQSEPFSVLLANYTNDDLPYKLLFVLDSNIQEECGCSQKTFSISNIRFSLNQVIAQSFESNTMTVFDGVLKKGESKTFKISMWISDQVLNVTDFHFHGHFVLEKA